ncbi:MAG TPA: hypothetical protein VES79_09350 [Solirubrobacteraceae bacterium]|nr:hypothetical protein [Solirubrobacteraceae bacterium]
MEPTGALFKVTWEAVLDPPANSPVPLYRWTAGFSDGSGAIQGAVAGPLLTLRMPYHASGATSAGFVCVNAEDAAGNVGTGVTCARLAVPAKPAPATTTHAVDYQEPTTKADGTPLQDLASIRLYWRVDGGPETVVMLPVSSPKGGVLRRFSLTVPATSGTLSVTVTAVDASGKESARSTPVTKTIGPPTTSEGRGR